MCFAKLPGYQLRLDHSIHENLASLSSVIGVFDWSMYSFLSYLLSRRLLGIGVSICKLLALTGKRLQKEALLFGI